MSILKLPLDPEILGRVVITPAALDTGIDVIRLLERHRSGDWGEISTEDRDENNLALADPQRPARLVSAYHCAGSELFVITYPFDYTTIMLSEEY